MKRTCIYTAMAVWAIGLAILPTAASQARGEPFLLNEPHRLAAALFTIADGPGRFIGAQSRPIPAVFAPDSHSNSGITLNSDEYARFRDIASVSRAGALEVGLVNVAVKGSGLLLGSMVWVGFLATIRRLFSYWWRETVWTDNRVAAAAICTLLASTAWVLGKMVD